VVLCAAQLTSCKRLATAAEKRSRMHCSTAWQSDTCLLIHTARESCGTCGSVVLVYSCGVMSNCGDLMQQQRGLCSSGGVCVVGSGLGTYTAPAHFGG
jgi:hypothetical protein